jgi:hypothetical protein
LSFHAAS